MSFARGHRRPAGWLFNAGNSFASGTPAIPGAASFNSLQTFHQIWHLIRVQRIGIILAGWLCLAAFTASAAHTQARLILAADTARPGETIWAGVDLKMEPGWHTYWKNSGAAGLPTRIEWQLPPGVTAGDILWPLPEKLPPAE